VAARPDLCAHGLDPRRRLGLLRRARPVQLPPGPGRQRRPWSGRSPHRRRSRAPPAPQDWPPSSSLRPPTPALASARGWPPPRRPSPAADHCRPHFCVTSCATITCACASTASWPLVGLHEAVLRLHDPALRIGGGVDLSAQGTAACGMLIEPHCGSFWICGRRWIGTFRTLAPDHSCELMVQGSMRICIAYSWP
jgi:hypothetical protein